MTGASLPTVSRETEDKFRLYEALLRKWQGAINLVGSDTLAQAYERHILDSAQLAAHVPADVKVLWDWGSGAGFPGLVLAMMRPDMAVHLVESDSRKCAFLKTVSRESATPATIHTARIESLAQLDEGAMPPLPDMITARALASLEALFAYALPWAARQPDLTLLFLKGAQNEAEIEAARAVYDFNVERYPSATAADSAILRIKNLRKKS